MPTYVYRCSGPEGHKFEWPSPITEGPLAWCWEPRCFSPVTRLIQPARIVVKGGPSSRFVNGERRLRREYVSRNPDGSETVYGSLESARRGEFDRLGHTRLGARIAQKNVEHLRQSGYVPGTRAAEFAQVLDDRVIR